MKSSAWRHASPAHLTVSAICSATATCCVSLSTTTSRGCFRRQKTVTERRWRSTSGGYPGTRGGLGFINIHIALQLSNQERFLEADALFGQAENQLQDSLEPTDEATLVSYRAIHLANQRKDEAALSLARQATQSRRELAEDFGYTFPTARSKKTTPGKMVEFGGFTTQKTDAEDDCAGNTGSNGHR